MILTVDESRALRALNVSGRRMIRRAGGWSVHARGDARTRALARLDIASTARLFAAGRLREAEGGGLILAAPHAHDAAATPPRSTPDRAFIVAGAPRAQTRGAGFHGLARQAEHGQGPLSRRAVRAGLVLIRLAEAANRQSGLVMDWSGTPRDRDARRSWRGGGVDAGARARLRLAAIREQAGETAYTLAWAACAEGASLSAIARRFGFPVRNAGPQLAAALEQVANASEGTGCKAH